MHRKQKDPTMKLKNVMYVIFLEPMNGEIQQLVTNEPIEFEK